MNFLIKLIIIAVTLLSIEAFASNHQVSEQGNRPNNILLSLKGQDEFTKEECFLFITDLGFIDNNQLLENFFAIVQTSYIHGEDQAAPIKIVAAPGKPGVFIGLGANGQDQIVLFSRSQDLNLGNVNSYNLKWLHGNHFHMSRCINMIPQNHDKH